MALIDLPTPIMYPGYAYSATATPTIAGLSTEDAAGEFHSVILCAAQAMVISHVGFRVTTATGSPTADVRIETVDAAGLPSGTLWAANTNLVTGALTTGWQLIALTAPATIAAGQVFCVKFLYNSGTTLTLSGLATVQPVTQLPYFVQNTGVNTKATAHVSLMALGSNATTFYPIRHCLPVTTVTNNTFNNTNAAARGARFKVPFKCRASGIRTWLSASVGDFNAVIYDDAGTELSSSSTPFDGDQFSNVNTGGAANCYFDNPVTLDINTWYRVALEPSSATAIAMSIYVLPSAIYMTAMWAGVNWHYATRATAVWDDTNTFTVPLLDILIDQVDDGTGSGGSTYPRTVYPTQ